jgi:DNA (cytosine-5)-methyltransferase 1
MDKVFMDTENMPSTLYQTRERLLPIELLEARSFAEFFAGIGLMRMGLELKGWNIAFANDISEDKYEMYSSQFHDAASHFRLEDIHNLNASDVPHVTLATASFPCNDLSLAGGRKGLGGKQSSAYWGFVRILDEMGKRRPPLVLIENVPGFLTSHGGRDFQAALLALNRLGYAVDPLMIDAVRFVPQSRVRLFVVGHLQDGHGGWDIRETLRFYESDARPKQLADFIFSHPEIVWDIRSLPRLPTSKSTIEDILDVLPEDSPEWWSAERCDYLINQMSKRHTEQLMHMKQEKRRTYGTVFRRIRKGRSMAELRTDGVAGCLRTPRGGSGRQILVEAGYDRIKVRLLTPRECARLMGADCYAINVTLNKALFGFGDAVCVTVIAWIAEHYLNPLLDEMQLTVEALS